MNERQTASSEGLVKIYAWPMAGLESRLSGYNVWSSTTVPPTLDSYEFIFYAFCAMRAWFASGRKVFNFKTVSHHRWISTSLRDLFNKDTLLMKESKD